jgi:haloalkane dehalogenase
MKTLTLPAGRLAYLDEGEGPPVVFAHGTPTNSYEFRHLVAALSPSHRCLAPDHLGFGRSERPAGFAYTPEAHAETFRRFVDALGLDRFTLVVHDYGGPIALPLALEEPSRVSRLVLINTWAWPFDDDPDMARKARVAGGRLGRFLYRRLNVSLRVLMPQAWGDRRKLTRELHRHYLSFFPDADSRGLVLWPLARALLASSDHYRALETSLGRLRDVPVLIVWGLRDRAFGPHQLERWKRALPGARVVTLAGAGHWPHEEEPAAVAGAVREFLAAPAPPRRGAAEPAPAKTGLLVMPGRPR